MITDCFRKMTPLEIISTSFGLVMKHLPVLVIVTALPEGVLLAMQLGFHDVLLTSPAGLPLVLVATVGANAVAMSAITTVMAGAVLGGAPTVSQTYQLVIRNRPFSLLAAYFATAFATSAGLMMFFFPGLFLGGLLALTIPAMVVEGHPAVEGIRRSALLVRGEVLKAMAIFGFVLLVSGIIPLMFQLMMGIGPLTPVIGTILAAVTMPVGYGASVVFYFSMRSREGYTPVDLEADLNARLSS